MLCSEDITGHTSVSDWPHETSFTWCCCTFQLEAISLGSLRLAVPNDTLIMITDAGNDVQVSAPAEGLLVPCAQPGDKGGECMNPRPQTPNGG